MQPDDIRLEEALSAFGRASLRVIALQNQHDSDKKRILDLLAEVDRLRYENTVLREAHHNEIARVRLEKADTELLPVAEELVPEPEPPRIVSPSKKNDPLVL